jgi:hypothetical protein
MTVLTVLTQTSGIGIETGIALCDGASFEAEHGLRNPAERSLDVLQELLRLPY